MSRVSYKQVFFKHRIGVGWSDFYVVGVIVHIGIGEIGFRLGKLDIFYRWKKK